jgi:polyhydroxybutyrate depolymerase
VKKLATSRWLLWIGLPAVLALVLLIVYRRSEAQSVRGGTEYTIEHGGRARRYIVRPPAGYDGNQPLPVVINFHGGGGTASAAVRQSRMDETADRHGFILVLPEGTGVLPRRFLTWNAGHCCAYAVENNIDDVGFVRKMLDDLQVRYRIDPRRVYATGISNGGMLCYRLACEMPDRIAAIAPVSANLGVDGPVPTRPVPIIHFHGLEDANVPFAGGVGANARVKVAHRSVPDTVAWFSKVNGIDPGAPQVEQRADAEIQRFLPQPGSNGAPIVVYKIREGGHTWPGGVDITRQLGTGNLVQTVDANELMWDFFRQFNLPEH